mmetsp:Transcript_23666/g.72816  ORF Transcript_23666/g.72816 Transcript_23666/m.72816 type:complete len:261 (+) Transcript_23666:278-1060(+)
MRLRIVSTRSCLLVCGLAIRTVSVRMITATSSKPAAFIVVPVSTKSTTASARPRPTAASTEPEITFTDVRGPSFSSRAVKYAFVSAGNDVAIRLPATSPCFENLPTGPCTLKRHLPKPSFINTSTSTSLSATMSSPVMPMSTSPSPTYLAMSDAGRNTRLSGRFVHFAMSNRSGRVYSMPAPFSNVEIFSYSRPFFGIPISSCCRCPLLPFVGGGVTNVGFEGVFGGVVVSGSLHTRQGSVARPAAARAPRCASLCIALE